MLLKRIINSLVFLIFITINPLVANDNVLALPERGSFLNAEDVFTLKDIGREGDSIVIEGHIAGDHYIYRHSLRLVDSLGVDIALELPAGISRQDEFFGDTEIYINSPLSLKAESTVFGSATLHWQGCAEAGLCYPPQIIQLELPDNDSAYTNFVITDIAKPEAPSRLPAGIAEDQVVAQRLANLNPIAVTLLFLGLGLLLAFTPCSLPMIPIISSLVIGSQAKPGRSLSRCAM